MVFTVIENPAFAVLEKAGFTRFQFQKLDALYLRAQQAKVLMARFVDCDFENGAMTFSYAKSDHHTPLFQFVIRQIGPRQVLYEVYRQGKGRAYKSGLFDRAYDRLESAIAEILPPPA